MQTKLAIRRYLITGSQRLSNYWWASIISLGGSAFLLTGFASFFKKSIFFPILSNQSETISFFPQGLVMCFYGCLGLLFGIYLWSSIYWEVGNGYNEFNKRDGIVRIFRWGLPGRDRRIDFSYKLDQIESVRVQLKEGVNPKRTISLKIKGKGNIPLTRIGQPIALQDIETEASELAQFLQVSLETSYDL